MVSFLPLVWSLRVAPLTPLGLPNGVKTGREQIIKPRAPQKYLMGVGIFYIDLLGDIRL
jgi:hypothetical protein